MGYKLCVIVRDKNCSDVLEITSTNIFIIFLKRKIIKIDFDLYKFLLTL